MWNSFFRFKSNVWDLKRFLTMPTGKAKTEKRRSLHLVIVFSDFASVWRSFTAASPKKDICNNWRIKTGYILFHTLSGIFLYGQCITTGICLIYSPNSEKWGTSKVLHTQRFLVGAALHPYQQDSLQWRHTSWTLWCGTPSSGLMSF